MSHKGWSHAHLRYQFVTCLGALHTNFPTLTLPTIAYLPDGRLGAFIASLRLLNAYSCSVARHRRKNVIFHHDSSLLNTNNYSAVHFHVFVGEGALSVP